MINMKNQTPEYEYFLRYHPGNTRVVLNTEAQFVEQHDYYPFGMEFAGRQGGDIKYRYDGKELQDMEIGGKGLDWYDYGARFYDSRMGKWNSQEPKAECYYQQSLYIYSGNNPILFHDFDGNDYGVTIDQGSKTITISAVYLSDKKGMPTLR